jgi:L-fuculokinase
MMTFYAVLDIGKTNKKISIYNEKYVREESLAKEFNEQIVDGLQVEPVEETWQWFATSMKDLSSRYPVSAVSVTAHGGTFVCVNDNGEVVVPVLSYTNDPGEEFHDQFYDRYGGPVKLHRETATPDMPGLGCVAKAIEFSRQRFPVEFQSTTHIVSLAGYYAMRLTGNASVDSTSLGSHTGLWDFNRKQYSRLVDDMNIRHLLSARVSHPWDVTGTVLPEVSRQTGLGEDVKVAAGIHDSNASLLPYILMDNSSFMLLSSGTVMVVMRPDEKAMVQDSMLGKSIYYNQGALGHPVKTVLFLAGLEFEANMGQLLAAGGGEGHPSFNGEISSDITSRLEDFILPSLVPFGIFPESMARVISEGRAIPFGEIAAGEHPLLFLNYERAYHVLCLSVAIQTLAALREGGMQPGDTVYLEGGFSRNDAFVKIMASLLDEQQLATSSLEEATSFGGALVAAAAHDGIYPGDLSGTFTVDYSPIAGEKLAGLDAYVEKFMNLVNANGVI